MYEVHFSVYKDSKLKKVLRVIRRVIKFLLLTVFLAGLSVFCFLLYRFGPTVKSYYDDAVEKVKNSSVSEFSVVQTSYVYASDGTQIAKLSQDKDVSYVKYSDLPDSVLKAFVAIEDKRFWKHSGVDWLSTAKAAFLLLKDHGEVTRGGSTITQQLARNVYLSFEQSYERKFREIFLALELEKKYSKESILEFYVNNINFANGYYGIGAAAKGYFGKSIGELSNEEIAFLCAIPNNPTYYNPRTNFEHTIQRRNLILKEMKFQGYLTEDEFLKAINSPVKLVTNQNEFYNYESSYAIDCAVRVLMGRAGFQFRYSFDTMEDYKRYRDNYNNSYEEAKIALYTGGYKVKTSIDLQAQRQLQQIIDSTLASEVKLQDDGGLVCQGAATVIDNQSGNVIAIVGGRSQDGNVRTLNRAYQSYRQPGSAIKPLIVYTPALERGYTPDSVVDDSPIEDGPKNSNGKYEGVVTLRHAVEQSKNVVAWRLFEEIKPVNGLSYVQSMGFAKIVPDDYYAPAALGGLTYGVSTVEMASGYSTLANSGVFRKPTCVTEMLDSNGNNVMTGSGAVRVYTEEAAQVMTDVLMGVAERGTASGLALSNGMPLACKTGTTNGQTVGWFCGFTPYYSIAVYVGADSNVSIDGLWGATYPMQIWQQMQEYLCANKEVIDLKHVIVTDAEQTTEVLEEEAPEVQKPVLPVKSEDDREESESSSGDSNSSNSNSSVPSIPIDSDSVVTPDDTPAVPDSVPNDSTDADNQESGETDTPEETDEVTPPEKPDETNSPTESEEKEPGLPEEPEAPEEETQETQT